MSIRSIAIFDTTLRDGEQSPEIAHDVFDEMLDLVPSSRTDVELLPEPA